MRPTLARAAVATGLVLALAPALRTDAPAAQETTEVRGAVPRWLVGRWLMLGTIEIAKPMPIVRLLEVRDGADHLEVLLGPTQLPQEMQAAMTGAPAGSPWVPSASDLRTLDRQWDALRAADPARAATVENQLLAAGEYPPEMTSDPRFRDTALAIVTRETFPGGQIAKTVSIWSVRDAASAPPAGPFGVLSIA
jgi:hypothetical protein